MSTKSLAILFVIRDGGGTASVELTVAEKLRARGHRIALYGPPETAKRAAARGFEQTGLPWPNDREPSDLMSQMIVAAQAWPDQIRPALANADLVIADCAWFGVLAVSRAAAVPSVGLMSTIYVADTPQFAHNPALVAAANAVRRALGQAEVESLTDEMLATDRLFTLTSRSFELPSVRPPAHVRYVGPQLSESTTSSHPDLRLPPGDAPVVLVSLSTTDQDQRELLRQIISEVGSLPVRAVVTLGPIDPDQLPKPDNVVLQPFASHDQILPLASLVITHARHGTVMAAVSAGVPLVCVPMGRDQPAVAARVSHHGIGVSVEPDAVPADLQMAVETVLEDPTYRAAAKRMVGLLEPAGLVVREVESCPGIS